VVATLTRPAPAELEGRECMLNGQPAFAMFLDGRPVLAILLGVADGRICRIFICADPARLAYVGSLQ